MDKMLLGVIGGMGPMASSYFYRNVIDLTQSPKDQDNLNMIISSKSTIPDRSAYILGKSSENPLPHLIESVVKLEEIGCTHLVMTCNTAHYFYEDIVKNINIPFLHMPEEAVREAVDLKTEKLGILASEGTIKTGIYQNICEKYDLKYEVLSQDLTDSLMSIIYDDIKQNKEPNMKLFNIIVQYLNVKGCDRFVLGCTELNILAEDKGLNENIFLNTNKIVASRVLDIFNKSARR